MPKAVTNAIHWRLIAIGMMVVGSLVLFMAARVGEKIEAKSALREAQVRPLLNQIDKTINTLLSRHRIDERWVKTWSVLTPDRRFIRSERRILVPPQFVSLDFNHDLSRELAGLGARVVATERTKESTVSMHIIVGRMIVESLVFVLKSDLE